MPIPTVANPVARSLLRDHVFTTLLDEIQNGELQPGQELSPQQLSERFGTSLHPVHEAINELAATGLVEVSPQRHTRVAPINLATALHDADVLAAIYVSVLRDGAALLTDDDLVKMSKLLDEAEASGTHIALIEHGLFDVPIDRYANRAVMDMRGKLLRRTRYALHAHPERALPATPYDEVRSGLSQLRSGDVLGATEHFMSLLRWFATEMRAVSLTLGSRATASRARGGTGRISASDATFEALQNAILDGTLSPGEKLSDARLMAWLDVSRVPLRKALRRLADQGLVTIDRSQHTRVAFADPRTLNEGIYLTGILHEHAARMNALQPDTPDLTELASCMAVLENPTTRLSRQSWGASINRYFLALDALSGNPRLVETVEAIIPSIMHALTPREGLLEDAPVIDHLRTIHAATIQRSPAAAPAVAEFYRATRERYLTEFWHQPSAGASSIT